MRLFKNRKYKSGTAWGVWLWTDVDSEYIVRLHLLKTPWFAVCLHWIKKPDAEPYFHDHPVTFLSLILRGQYAELRQEGCNPARLVVRRWCNYIRASRHDRHRIVLARKNTLTLCLMGPKRQDWGFFTEAPQTQENFENGCPAGWISWQRYYKKQRADALADLDRSSDATFIRQLLLRLRTGL